MPVLAIVGAVAVLSAAALSAHAAFEEGKAQEDIADANAAEARREGKVAFEAAKEDARVRREQGRRDASAQGAGFLGVGGVAASGSVQDILTETAFNAEFDAQKIMFSGKETRRAKLREAQLFDFQGTVAKRQSHFRMASTLLAGVAGAVGFSAQASTPTQAGQSTVARSSVGTGTNRGFVNLPGRNAGTARSSASFGGFFK